jgi:hypothetical protein
MNIPHHDFLLAGRQQELARLWQHFEELTLPSDKARGMLR